MSGQRRIRAVTPAKVNLGLEVVRRREDGYHEIVTIIQAVSLFDQFTWEATGEPFEYAGLAHVPPEDDLIDRALALAPDRARWTGRLTVHKRIPAAAGLGGGSSDAALALRLALPDEDDACLIDRASRLGSDVPFFLRGGTALATGTGTDLQPLPTPNLWFVLVTPPLAIAGKTAAMYRGLDARDFSDGMRVHGIAARLRHGLDVGNAVPNAFLDQLLSFPVVRYAYDRLLLAGSSVVSVSGAGPTVYAVVASYHDASRIAMRLPGDVGAVRIARSVAARCRPSIRDMARSIRGERD